MMHLDDLLSDDPALDAALGALPAAQPRASAAVILELARAGAVGVEPSSADDLPGLIGWRQNWVTWASRIAAVLVIGVFAAAGWTAVAPWSGGPDGAGMGAPGVLAHGLQAELDHALAGRDLDSSALVEIDTLAGSAAARTAATSPGVFAVQRGNGLAVAVAPPSAAAPFTYATPLAGVEGFRDPSVARDDQLVLAVAGTNSSPAGTSRTRPPSTVRRLDVAATVKHTETVAVVLSPTRLRAGGSLMASRDPVAADGATAGPGLALGLVHVVPTGRKVSPTMGAGLDLGLLAAAEGLLPHRTGGVHLDCGITVDGGRAEVQLGWSVGGRLTAPAAATAGLGVDGRRSDAAVAQFVTGPTLGVTIPMGHHKGLHLDATVAGGLVPRGDEPPVVQPWFGLVAGVEFGLPRSG